MKNFITTSDKKTVDKLISSGFQLVSQSDNMYTFINHPPVNFTFDEVDKKKIVYTNTLNI